MSIIFVTELMLNWVEWSLAYLTISNSIWATTNFGLNAQAGGLLKRLSVTRIGPEWIFAFLMLMLSGQNDKYLMATPQKQALPIRVLATNLSYDEYLESALSNWISLALWTAIASAFPVVCGGVSERTGNRFLSLRCCAALPLQAEPSPRLAAGRFNHSQATNPLAILSLNAEITFHFPATLQKL